MANCANCNIETTNPRFCTRSCSASFNNKAKPKRVLTRKCTKCTNIAASYRTRFCEQHLKEHKRGELCKTYTIGEYRNKISVSGKHPSWLHSHVRLFAGRWLKELKEKPCAFCGYDKFVELAHIKAVKDFDDAALMGDVNHLSNVIQLCPNCHWEFDNTPRTEKMFSRLTQCEKVY